MATKAISLRIPSWRVSLSTIALTEEHKRFLVRAALVTLSIRIALVVAAYVVGYTVVGREDVGAFSIFDELFARWDGDNFLRLAQSWYESEGPDRVHLVYLPLYPLAIKVVAQVVQSYLVSAMFISAVCAMFAGFFIQVLIRQNGGDEGEATRGLVYMSLFPTAYFLALPYSEAMFLALAIASFVAARSNHWLWAGVLGGLATATRIQAVAILPALLLEAIIRERWQVWRKAWGLVLAPTGLLVYLGINWAVGGHPLEFVDIQREHWSQDSVTPWKFMSDTISGIRNLEPGFLRAAIYEMRLASVIIAVVILIMGIKRIPISLQVFAWVTLFFMMSTSWQISMPRYLLGMFPLFLILAYYGRNTNVHQVIITLFPFLMGTLFVVYATRFGF